MSTTIELIAENSMFSPIITFFLVSLFMYQWTSKDNCWKHPKTKEKEKWRSLFNQFGLSSLAIDWCLLKHWDESPERLYMGSLTFDPVEGKRGPWLSPRDWLGLPGYTGCSEGWEKWFLACTAQSITQLEGSSVLLIASIPHGILNPPNLVTQVHMSYCVGKKK